MKITNDDSKKGIINFSFADVTEDVNLKSEKSEIIGYLKIDKINLYKELYGKGSSENTVEKNIQILDASDMPDVINGNFILAAHSGFSSTSYFHNLNKLDIGDSISFIYNDMNYNYVIDNIYDVPKTGKVLIKRNTNKTAVTLITCFGENRQLVVIGYLI